MPNEPKKNANYSPAERHQAREYAAQAMYQWLLTQAAPLEIEKEFTQHRIIHPLDLDYFKELVHGIPAEQADIDKTLEPFLARHLEEIDPVELSILRLATYELLCAQCEQ